MTDDMIYRIDKLKQGHQQPGEVMLDGGLEWLSVSMRGSMAVEQGGMGANALETQHACTVRRNATSLCVTC